MPSRPVGNPGRAPVAAAWSAPAGGRRSRVSAFGDVDPLAAIMDGRRFRRRNGRTAVKSAETLGAAGRFAPRYRPGTGRASHLGGLVRGSRSGKSCGAPLGAVAREGDAGGRTGSRSGVSCPAHEMQTRPYFMSAAARPADARSGLPSPTWLRVETSWVRYEASEDRDFSGSVSPQLVLSPPPG